MKLIPIFLQLMEIGFLFESKKIIHGDIAPNNFILFDDFKTIKITDFGYFKKARL